MECHDIPFLTHENARRGLVSRSLFILFFPHKYLNFFFLPTGEGNVGNPKYYGCAFPAMINDWRANWKLSPAEFPFFFVQLAAYTQGTSVSRFATFLIFEGRMVHSLLPQGMHKQRR